MTRGERLRRGAGWSSEMWENWLAATFIALIVAAVLTVQAFA